MGVIETITSFEGTVVLYILTLIGTSLTALYTILLLGRPVKKMWKGLCIGLCVVLTFFCIRTGLSVIRFVVGVPTVLATTPKSGAFLDTLAPTVDVVFRNPVDYRTLQVHAFPERKLRVVSHGYFGDRLPFGRTLSIIPETTIPPGERIMIYLSHLSSMKTRGFGSEHLLEFVAPDPEIVAVEPPVDISSTSPGQIFAFHLSSPSSTETEWSVTSEPPHPIDATRIDNTTLRISPRQPYRQGTLYTLSLVQTPVIADKITGEILSKQESRVKKTVRFTTARPAFVASFEPQGSAINPEDSIRITFDQPMDTDSVEASFTVTPRIDPHFAWQENGSSVLITHAPLEKNTRYAVSLATGMKTARGGTLPSPVTFEFHTAGPLVVTRTAPEDREGDVSIRSRVAVSFDQPVSPSAKEKFSIIPNIPGTITTTNNTIIFTPTGEFAYATEYKISLAEGSESLWGFPSDRDYSFSFLTQEHETVIPVPFYKQQAQFTCNIAAARMLLAFRGILLDEKTLISAIGNGGKRGSGNPHKGYIDDYGTYWEAVAKGVSSYRPNRLITSGKLEDVIAEIKKGTPVMIWGQNGWSDPHDLSWTSSDGTFIKAINGMHSSVVRGFRGDADNPTHILLNDPWRGQYAIETSEFLRRWGFLGMAMVVE